MMVIRPKHVAVTEQNIQTSVALDGNPEPDLVHATGCKQPTLRPKSKYCYERMTHITSHYFSTKLAQNPERIFL
jgi:hypothetical protein